MPAHDAVGTIASGPATAAIAYIGAGRGTDHDVRGKVVPFDLAFTMTTAHLLLPMRWMHDPQRLGL